MQVGDVIDHLLRSFHTPLRPVQDKEKDANDDYNRNQAFGQNAYHRSIRGQPVAQMLRRVDLLLGEPVFDGLSAAPDVMLNRYGERDAGMLLMHFKPRDGSW